MSDEPVSALDLSVQAQVVNLLRSCRAGWASRSRSSRMTSPWCVTSRTGQQSCTSERWSSPPPLPTCSPTRHTRTPKHCSLPRLRWTVAGPARSLSASCSRETRRLRSTRPRGAASTPVVTWPPQSAPATSGVRRGGWRPPCRLPSHGPGSLADSAGSGGRHIISNRRVVNLVRSRLPADFTVSPLGGTALQHRQQQPWEPQPRDAARPDGFA